MASMLSIRMESSRGRIIPRPAARNVNEVLVPFPAPAWRPSVNPWIIAVSVMLATFMEVLDTSVANVSLPHIAGVAELALLVSYTRIVAPEAGRVTRRTVEEGMYVQVGQVLMSIVPNDFWVVANFKETQLKAMHPGQPAEIKVDAFKNEVVRGHVDSIQAGTGSRFSLLPPENATGNYVKVVQRVPVKIVFDPPLPDPSRLGPGMSVVVTVKTR
jgi:multidrug efflux pump subunit AcrA (membrane-fusion protein)